MLAFLASCYIHRTLTMGSEAYCKALSVLDPFSPCNSGNFRHQPQVQQQLPSLTSQSISFCDCLLDQGLTRSYDGTEFFSSSKFGFYFSKHCPQYTQCFNNSAPWNLCILSFLFLKRPSYSQVYWPKLPTVVTGMKIKRKENSLLGVRIGNSGWTSLPPYIRPVTREELS